jgi:hypothetical protein
MEDEPNEFKDWMDGLGLQAKDVAARLHVEEQTIRQWRTYGVPQRRRPHVRNIMAEWGSEPEAPEITEFRQQTLVVRTTPEQFRRWESATRAAGEDHVEDWARNTLEAMSSEENVIPITKASEEGAADPYGTKKQRGAGGKMNAPSTPPGPPPPLEDKNAV